MAKRNKIKDGLLAAVSYAKGDRTKGKSTLFNVPEDVNVRKIRHKLGLSQREFALQFGFGLGTLQHWEQGDRIPDASARVLLTVISHDPEIVRNALKAVSERKVTAIG